MPFARPLMRGPEIKRPMSVLINIYNFFRSFGFAAIIFALLTVITLLGTIDQAHLGLYGAVKHYFQSFWPIKSDYLKAQWNIPIPIFLPGGMFLMLLLFINMSLGGLVHVRKRLRGLPNLITHIGMMFLLISGFVTFIAKNDGYIALFPGQASNRANSYKTWQMEVLEFDENNKPVKAHIIPWETLLKIGESGEQEFVFPDLPFSVKLDTFFRNSQPFPTTDSDAAKATTREVNGYKLLKKKKSNEEERNLPGCFARILSGDDKKEISETIIWARSAPVLPGQAPLVAGFEVGGKQYGLQLVKTNWPVDYYVKLDKFIFEKHPGTQKPKNFESRITRLETLESDEGKKVAIRMNEPMRHDGFVVFQEQYGQGIPKPVNFTPSLPCRIIRPINGLLLR